MERVRDWKRTFGEAVGGGVGSVAALTVAGWPGNAAEAAWVGLGGLVIGLVLAAAYILRLHAETRRLQGIEREFEQQQRQHAFEVRHHEYRLAVAQREAALNAIAVKVWGGAFNEVPVNQRLSAEAIMARLEMETKAANLDVPIEPPQP